jgi:hypothetical protein
MVMRCAGRCLFTAGVHAVLVVAPPVASATHEAAPAAQGPSLEVEASALVLGYAAAERLGRTVLNREQGRLAGGRVALRRGFGFGEVGGEVRAEVEQARGEVAYTGFTQFGIPLATSTRLRIDRQAVGVAVPRGVSLGFGELGFDAALEHLRVDREITATPRTGALRERLRLGVARVGALWSAPGPGPARLELALHWRQPWSSRLRVDTAGVFDPYRLRPDRAGWAAAEVAGRWPLGAGVALDAGFGFEQPRFGASPSVVVTRGGRPAAVSSYPGSRQTWRRFALGLDFTL